MGRILGHEGVGIVEEVGSGCSQPPHAVTGSSSLRRSPAVPAPTAVPGTTPSAIMRTRTVRTPAPRSSEAPKSSGSLRRTAGRASHGFLTPTSDWYAYRTKVRTMIRRFSLSDIFPTGYMAADIAEIGAGDTVAVFGCGPVGQFAIVSAMLLGAGRVIAIDRGRFATGRWRARSGPKSSTSSVRIPSRRSGELTGGIGVDRAIDAVGSRRRDRHLRTGRTAKRTRRATSSVRNGRPSHRRSIPKGDLWQPGHAPSQVIAVGGATRWPRPGPSRSSVSTPQKLETVPDREWP